MNTPTLDPEDTIESQASVVPKVETTKEEAPPINYASYSKG